MSSTATEKRTVADAIVAQLAAAGIPRVYGVVGDAVFPLMDALSKQDAVQFIMATHEQHAAFMASYEAKLTGRPTVCIATAGPGATNLATGIADAHFDGAPLIAITGQVPTGKFGTRAKQYFDQQSFFRPIVSSTELVLNADGALNALTMAIVRSRLTRQVMHLSIPTDVLTQQLSWGPLPVAKPAVDSKGNSLEGRSPLQPAGGDDLIVGDWDKALEALHASRRPLIVLGSRDHRAALQARALAKSLGAALVAAQHAKGTVPFTDEHLIGGIGEAYVPPMVQQADLVVLIGTPGYEERFIPPHAPVIILDTQGRPLPGRTILALKVGPLAESIEGLHEAVNERPPDGPWLQEIAKARAALHEQERNVLASDETPVNPYRLALALQGAVAPDAVVTLDIGGFTHWIDLGFRIDAQTLLISPTWRSLGTGLPAAIAARLAYPDRQVVAVVGDGGLMMALGEIVTAVRYRLPLIIVVVRNAVYDIEAQKMQARGMGTLGTHPGIIDFVAYAKACGAEASRVDSPDALPKALRAATDKVGKGADVPILVEVATSVPKLPHVI